MLLCFFLGTAIEIDAHGIAERDDGRLGQARPLCRTIKFGQDTLKSRHHAHVEERRRNRAVAYLGEARLELPDRHILFQQSRHGDFQAVLVKHKGDAPRRCIVSLADSTSKQAAHEVFRKFLQSARLDAPRQKMRMHIVRRTVHLLRQGTSKLFAADEIKTRRTEILGALDESFGEKFLRRACEQMPAARRTALTLLLTQKLPCQEILLLQAHDVLAIRTAFPRFTVHHAAEFLDLHITDCALGRELIGAAVRARKKKLLYLVRLGEARRTADAHVGAIHHAQFLDEIRLFHTGKNLHDNDLPSILQFHTDARENARLTAVENSPRDIIDIRNDLRLCRESPAAFAVEDDASASSVRKSHGCIQKRSALRHDLLHEIAANPRHFFLHIQHLSAIRFLRYSITVFPRKVQKKRAALAPLSSCFISFQFSMPLRAATPFA